MLDASWAQRELAELREGLGHISTNEWTDGRWLLPVMAMTLDDYPAEVTLQCLRDAHPEVHDPTELADARIRRAQWLAAAGGGVSAGAYATVVMGSLVTGTFVGAALPAAVLAWGLDMAFLARTQLCLAWDLSVIYGQALDPSDDEQAWLLARVAFGVDPQSHWSQGAKATVPLASRFGTRALTTSARLATGVTAIGRTLALRSLSKMAIPAIGVPLCAGVNHWTTGAVGRHAERLFRGDAARSRVQNELEAGSDLIVSMIRTMVEVDGEIEAQEAPLLDAIDRTPIESLTPPELLERIQRQPHAVRVRIHEAARAAADLDGIRGPREQQLLDSIAGVCAP